MRIISIMLICMAIVHVDYAQPSGQKQWTDLARLPGFDRAQEKIDMTPDQRIVDSMLNIVNKANEHVSLTGLAAIVNTCAACCQQSENIASSLTQWLKENHSIYTNRTATDANQFRGFLLASLAKFPPTEELYRYVKSEFIFGGHAFNIAAAAFTARNFRDEADELVPLMEPYLNKVFVDKLVDITTPELEYPVSNPTKARYEIIRTLASYRVAAFRSVELLDAIAAGRSTGIYGTDSTLISEAEKAAAYLRKVTPECCRKESVEPVAKALNRIQKLERKKILNEQYSFIDQEGNSVQLRDINNKPFVLTFFYTQCANPLKCVSTVHRLGKLEEECKKNRLQQKVGLYAMTYDPDFDSPSALKRFGEQYGIEFGRNVKFLKAADISQDRLNAQLNLRVSYGGGSVNQHGLQLFIFDRNGKLAATSDNELWEVDEVYQFLEDLVREK